MRSLKMGPSCVCLFALLIRGSMLMELNSTIVPLLQELCPYTSFCEIEPALNVSEDSHTRIPCCEPCSCKPDCEEYGNCCFDNTNNSESTRVTKCTSPVVSRTKIPTTEYVMVHSCPTSINTSMCEVNDTDYKSFAPVSCEQTGSIYVNAECALCNKALKISPWQLAIKCPENTDDHSFDTLRLLRGEDIGETGCHMAYVPPKHINVESRQCVTDAIRECNTTGIAIKWEPMWNYCPMFNATYSTYHGNTFYGNVFCFLCNLGDVTDIECEGAYQRGQDISPFTAIIDNTLFEMFRETNNNNNECSSNDKLLSPLQSPECRRKVCPTGKFRVGTKCGFYSSEWTGGPFTVTLKLTPVKSVKIPKTFLSELDPEVRYNLKAKWLNRTAMKRWNIKTLYKPSENGTRIDYFIAVSSYPSSKVNPSRLERIIRHTLAETWLISVNNTTVPLQVEFHFETTYVKRSPGFVDTDVDTDDAYVFVSANNNFLKDKIFFQVYFPANVHLPDPDLFLTEMFLCDQVELRPDEYEIIKFESLLIPSVNLTLPMSQYRLLEFGSVSVCEHRLYKNECKHVGFEFKSILFALSFFYLVKRLRIE